MKAEFGEHVPAAKVGEQRQCQHEVHDHPGRQLADAALPGAGRLQGLIDQVGGEGVFGQGTEVRGGPNVGGMPGTGRRGSRSGKAGLVSGGREMRGRHVGTPVRSVCLNTHILDRSSAELKGIPGLVGTRLTL